MPGAGLVLAVGIGVDLDCEALKVPAGVLAERPRTTPIHDSTQAGWMSGTDTGGDEPPRHAETPFTELDLNMDVGVEYIGGESEADLAVIHDPEHRSIPGGYDEMVLREAIEIADEFCVDCFTRASWEANLLPRNVDGEVHLHIRANTTEDDHDGADSEGRILFRRLLENDAEGDSEYELVYADPTALREVTRPEYLELLRVIVRQEPASIAETARLVDRDPAEVKDRLEALEELWLLVLEPSEAGPRPAVRYDRLTIDLPLAENLEATPEDDDLSFNVDDLDIGEDL